MTTTIKKVKEKIIPRSESFKKVVRAVRKLNPEAAKYLMSKEVESVYNFNTNATNVDRLFTWSYTPQGSEFWSKLHQQTHESLLGLKNCGKLSLPYKNLVKKVRLVDTKAAKYLMSKDVKKLSSFNPNSCDLTSVFGWSSTPQGFEYWSKLSDLIKGSTEDELHFIAEENKKKSKTKKNLILEKEREEKRKFINQQISLESEINTFYLLQEMKALVDKKSFSLPSQLAFVKRLEDYQTEQSSNLALAMRDYTALACFGEARYGFSVIEKREHNKKIRIKTKFSRRNRFTREGCYEEALQFDPTQMLKDLRNYFLHNDWAGGCGFGGQAWAKAAEYALDYGVKPDIIFVDNMVDLQHNSGTLFSKPCIFKYEEGIYNAIKRKANGTVLFTLDIHVVITLKALQLLKNFVEMNIANKIVTTVFGKHEDSDFIPLPWGFLTLERDYIIDESEKDLFKSKKK